MTDEPTVQPTEAERDRIDAAWADVGITHMDRCPAHLERVRNVGPCSCGAEVDQDELDAAIRAPLERELETLRTAYGIAHAALVLIRNRETEGTPAVFAVKALALASRALAGSTGASE